MREQQHSPWAEELNSLIRASAGGFLFGVPLLYTMEMWWFGTFVDPPRVFAALALTFFLNYVLLRFSGFQSTTALPSVTFDVIKAMAVGIVLAAITLWTLERITFAGSVYVPTAKILVEAIPFSIGASLANSLLKATGGGRRQSKAEQQNPHDGARATLQDVGVTVVGAVLISLSIAPTAEVPTLAFELNSLHRAVLIVLSFVVTYVIVFQAGFSNEKKRLEERGLFQSPFTETTLSYLIALILSALLLLLFNRISLHAPWSVTYSQTIVLGFPAAIGGAAGRLIS